MPGPTLRANVGDRIRVRLVNNEMDGVPGVTQSLVAPGETFTYEFVTKDAGTFWFTRMSTVASRWSAACTVS